jgi:hypothetical protein
MTRDRKPLQDDLTGENGGWLDRLLADEAELDRRSLWRLGSWGVGAVAALVVAILAAQSPATMRRDQIAAAEIARQTQQVQWVAQESQKQTRQLSAAVETLNSDRDRLYARLTVLEQGLDSVTGALARQTVPPAPSPPSSVAAAAAMPMADAMAEHAAVPATENRPEPVTPPKVAPVATIVPVSPVAKPDEKKTDTAKGASGNPEGSNLEASANEKTKAEPATAISKAAPPETPPSPATTGALPGVEPASQEVASLVAVARTEFGVDLGGANSVEGLRALWRGALKSNSQHLGAMQPVIMIRERRDGMGLQLRLVAGPLADAAAAARICAALLTESNRACETSVYDGQRLALHSEKAPDQPPAQRPKRRSKPHAEQAPAKPKTTPSFSSFFGVR